MAVNLSPLFNEQILTLAGVPASGYKLFTYAAGSTTKTNTYTTSAGNVANANPIVLDSNGYPSNGAAQVQIWLTAGTSYKFVLAPSTDTDPPTSAILTEDNITGVNDTVSSSVTEWTASTFTGITFVSGTQFTVTGDQTSILTLNRRLKTTNTAGTIYSYISAVDYNISNAGKTTVTVVNDSGTLDSGLSAVSYGIINPTNSSLFPAKVTQNINFAGSDTFSGTKTFSGAALNEAAEVSIASAATVNIGAAASNNVLITGTTTITAFDNVAAGIIRKVRFNGILTLTHNGTSLILPGSANITTAANDCGNFESLGSGNWICRSYTPARGPETVWLGTVTASNSATVSFTSFIDSTFKKYLIRIVNMVPVSTGFSFQAQVHSGGVFKSGGTDYTYAVQTSTGATWTGGSSAASVIPLSGGAGVSNAGAASLSGEIEIFNPSEATYNKLLAFKMVYLDNAAGAQVLHIGSVRTVSTAVDGIQFFMSTGNISLGTFMLYGIR